MIYADLHKTDDEGHLILTCFGTRKDLADNNVVLEDNLKLVFYMDDGDLDGNKDDLIFEGVVNFDPKNNRWVATIDWDGVKNLSKLTLEEKTKLGLN